MMELLIIIGGVRILCGASMLLGNSCFDLWILSSSGTMAVVLWRVPGEVRKLGGFLAQCGT